MDMNNVKNIEFCQMEQMISEVYELAATNSDQELKEEYAEETANQIFETNETKRMTFAKISENKTDIEHQRGELIISLLPEKNYQVSKSEEQNCDFIEILLESVNNEVVDEPDYDRLFCRLCATRCNVNNTVHIFQQNKTSKCILEKIERCLSIVVKETDKLPQQACYSCLDKLELCYEFHETVANAEKQFLLFTNELSSFPNETVTHIDNLCSINPEERRIVSESKNELEIKFEGNKIPESNKLSENKNTRELTGNKKSIDDIILCDKEMIIKDEIYSEHILIHEKTIKCRICGEYFQTVKKCYIHSSVHATDNNYPCCLCERVFTDEKECNEHVAEHIVDCKKRERKMKVMYICNECGKKFLTQDRLEFHEIYHNSNSNSRQCYCERCDKVMISESALYRHMLTVHKRYKEYCCDICGKQFRGKAQLSAHQRKHNDERPFECLVCEKRFYSKDILRRHEKLHDSEKLYQCNQCGKKFDRNNTLTKHLLRHRAEAGLSMNCHICNICQEVFMDGVSAKKHLEDCEKMRKENEENKIVEIDLKKIYRCEYCEKCYSKIEFMKNHKSSHNGVSPYLCTICDTNYETYNQVTAHKIAHKKSSKSTNQKNELIVIPKYFVCEYCDKNFLHFTNMNIHRRSCLNGKIIWTCKYCANVFKNPGELSKHKKGESEGKIWLCNKCESYFGSKCALKIHEENHNAILTEKKHLACLHCGKTFTQKSHLTIHVRSHTGERPYNCDLCEKSYKIKTERDNHRRTHSGEKPFKCEMCEKKFASTARLREHRRFHSGKRPYACSLCDQSFKKANARNVHMTTHTSEKPYQCDICGSNFKRIGDMRKHRRIQHRKILELKNDDDETIVNNKFIS